MMDEKPASDTFVASFVGSVDPDAEQPEQWMFSSSIIAFTIAATVLKPVMYFPAPLGYTKDNWRIHLLCGKKDGFCPLQVVDVKLTNCIMAGFCFVQHFLC